jgi:iron complex outermembrane receptor protein
MSPTPFAAACRAGAAFFLSASLAAGASAQTAPAPAPAPAASAPRATTLAPVLITGNPLGSAATAAPATVLSGEELILRRGSSLGETLDGQPGVASTYFGPNANRPVIRGLDGDRVRMLSNSGGSVDASSLSFDHAVPIDPLVVERIEVLRGPAALLYGGSAIGGVVNAIDNRIPKAPLDAISGAAELRLGGAERERGGGAVLEAGNGRFAVHADAFGRETSDLIVPLHTPVAGDGTTLAPTRRVRNSAARTQGGALGASWTFAGGYLGLAADTYDSDYGPVAEEDVTIRMKRHHVALAGEWRDLGGPFRTIRLRLDDTRYRHREIEGDGEVGTTFESSGGEGRLELEHAPLGPLKGVLGVQAESTRFSALGEEAFVPSTRTRKQALFLLEEMASPFGTWNGGVRVERARVASEGDADPDQPRFGPPVERSFTLTSASLGNSWPLSPTWTLSGTFGSTARAPTSFELFANGVHAATGAFERGDASLGRERGNNVDLALQWKSGTDHVRLGVFAARFDDFVSLEATGNSVSVIGDDGPESFPEFVYRAVPAELRGIELEAGHRLLEREAWTLDLSGKLDAIRGNNRDSGEPLPRIAPLRLRLGLDAARGPWLGRVELDVAARQDRVARTDRSTHGYALLNLAFSHRFQFGGTDVFAYLKATNLFDRLAYSATTTETIRGLVPLPGRAIKAGLRLDF